MRHNPKHAVTDEQVVRRLIAENPWATIVSRNGGELVASHYPVLLDEEADGLAVVTHVGRPDERVHALGQSEVILEPDENLRVLTRLVDHFERHVASPVPLAPEVGARLAPGTVGLRLPIDRFVCKVKMSQDKDEPSRRRVLEELRGDGPYAQPALAADMERALGEGQR